MSTGRVQKYNVLSLFSGCGGLDLGFAQLGARSLELEKVGREKRKSRGNRFEIVWANDIYAPSCQTYSANFDVEIYTDPEEPYAGKSRLFQGDISNVFFQDAVDAEPIHVVLGGFPCQDFSVIRGKNKRLGIKVKRGRLYCHFVRALAWLQPEMFVAENVKGLVSANDGLAYEQIKDDFTNLRIRWSEIEVEYKNHAFRKKALNSRKLEEYELLFSAVINSANLGVPQARERLIIIGLRKDLFQKLDYPKAMYRELSRSLRGEALVFSKFPLTPMETLQGQPLGSLQEEYKKTMLEFEQSIPQIDSKRKQEFIRHVWPEYTMDAWQDYLWLNSNNKKKNHLMTWVGKEGLIQKAHARILSELGYLGRPLDKVNRFEDRSNTILRETKNVKKRMEFIPPGENHEFVKDTDYHVTGLMSNIYRRVHPLKPSYTIIAKGGGGTWGYHYRKDRQRLTNRERARLQTFPDSFVLKGKPAEVRTQLGEAVPPLASKVIAKRVANILDKVS